LIYAQKKGGKKDVCHWSTAGSGALDMAFKSEGFLQGIILDSLENSPIEELEGFMVQDRGTPLIV
jgi:hypothetical protein